MVSSVNAMTSRLALGLKYIDTGLREGRGDMLMTGAGKVGTAPFAPWADIAQGLVGDAVNDATGSNLQMGLGAKIRSAVQDPESARAVVLGALANAVKEGGMRIRMEGSYKNSAPERMMAAIKAGDPIKGAALSVPALFETIAKPLMEHIVPLQKLTAYGEMAQYELAKLPPDATLMDRRMALQNVQASVDNRFGQLVYDNLHWNKTFKLLMQISTRSVGWNIGTIRELGGGAGDLVGNVKDAALNPSPKRLRGKVHCRS